MPHPPVSRSGQVPLRPPPCSASKASALQEAEDSLQRLLQVPACLPTQGDLPSSAGLPPSVSGRLQQAGGRTTDANRLERCLQRTHPAEQRDRRSRGRPSQMRSRGKRNLLYTPQEFRGMTNRLHKPAKPLTCPANTTTSDD